MEKNEKIWAVIGVGIILLAYVIPYTILSDVAKWYGSFLFWSLIAVVAIGINIIVTRDWSDN